MKVLLIVILLLLLLTCLCGANGTRKGKKMLKRQINSVENCNYLDTLNNSDILFSNRNKSHFKTNCISAIAIQTAYSKR